MVANLPASVRTTAVVIAVVANVIVLIVLVIMLTCGLATTTADVVVRIVFVTTAAKTAYGRAGRGRCQTKGRSEGPGARFAMEPGRFFTPADGSANNRTVGTTAIGGGAAEGGADAWETGAFLATVSLRQGGADGWAWSADGAMMDKFIFRQITRRLTKYLVIKSNYLKHRGGTNLRCFY